MSVNEHLEHIEDLIFNHGVDGTRSAILIMNELANHMSGEPHGGLMTSVKWDGAPSVVVGHDPEDGQFFVATKSIFNKTPKVYKTIAEIEQDTKGELQEKLKACFEYFPSLNIQGVVQGDLLFLQKDLYPLQVGQTQHTAFHPNTIVYSVPTNSGRGCEILRSKIGVVWHTVYRGESIKALRTDPGAEIKEVVGRSEEVWWIDPSYGSLPILADEPMLMYRSKMSRIGRLFRQIKPETLNGISANPERLMRFKAFINSKIRHGEPIGESRQAALDLVEYTYEFYESKIDMRKTARGKMVQQDKLWDVFEYFTKVDLDQMTLVFDLYNAMMEAKIILIGAMSDCVGFNPMFRLDDGYKPTKHEGFVVGARGRMAKLVNRLEFSYANFANVTVKGWDHDRVNP